MYFINKPNAFFIIKMNHKILRILKKNYKIHNKKL
jgi:hypothetical protein